MFRRYLPQHAGGRVRQKAAPVLLALSAVTAGAVMVTVHPGDTLSGIAQKHCGKAADWTGIYDASRNVVGANPDLIYPGQKITVSCTQDPDAVPARQAAWHPAQNTGGGSASSGGTVQAAPGSFQACVIARESGGNAQVWNATGHWGLYQFSYGTWVAHGGDPALFGNAGAAYQTQIFWNTVAKDGTSDWAPYDGC